MVDSLETIADILGHLSILIIVVILILYMMHRDAKRQEILGVRYDKFISIMLDNVTKQQDLYKKEIIAEVRELSTVIVKVFAGIERVVIGVKDLQLEVTKVTDNVKEVSSGVDRVVVEVDRMIDGITEVSSGIKDIVTIIDKELEARSLSFVFEGKKDLSIIEDNEIDNVSKDAGTSKDAKK